MAVVLVMVVEVDGEILAVEEQHGVVVDIVVQHFVNFQLKPF